MKARFLSSSLEALEPRIAPANVAAGVIRGTLVVEPIDPAESISATVVQTGPDAFDVLDDGQLLGSFSSVRELRLRGGAGTDTLTLDPVDTAVDRFRGQVAISAGGGRDDVITVAAGELGGDVLLRGVLHSIITTDPGTVVLGDLQVVGDGPSISATLEGNFGNVFTTGLKYVEFGEFLAAGDVRVIGRANAFNELTTHRETQIDGAFTFRHPGEAGAWVTIVGTEFGGPVNLRLGGQGNAVNAFESSFDGALTIQGRNGNDNVSLKATTTQGPVDINVGGGENHVRIEGGSVFGAEVTVAAAPALSFTALTVEDPVVAGLFTIEQAGHWFEAYFYGATLLGGLAVDGGLGKTLVFTDSTTRIAGEVVFHGGNGGNRLTIGEVGDLLSVRYFGGGKHDSLEVHGSGGRFLEVEAHLGRDIDVVRINCVDYLRIAIDGGPGSDILYDGEALTGPRVRIADFERFLVS